MVSIIVCSINTNLFNQFENSLSETIGLEFELVRIDNNANKYSICEAYNLGASVAKFDYLCFAHEDILFKSDNWGKVLTAAFEADPKIGVVGIAGSKYKSLSPGGWPNGQLNLDCFNIIQQDGDERVVQVINPEIDSQLVEVKTLDGVFLFTKKAVWETNRFDAHTFKGFHCYDLDFCLQAGRNYKVMVCYQLQIEHISMGSENREWVTNSILLSKKWNDYLPVGTLSYNDKMAVEWYQKRLFALKMNIQGFSFSQIISVFVNFGYFKFFNLKGNRLFLNEIFKSVSKKIAKS